MPSEAIGYIGFGVLAGLLVLSKFRYGQAWAWLLFLLGLSWFFLVPAELLVWAATSQSDWLSVASGIGILWGFFFVLDLALFRRYSPMPAHEEAVIKYRDTIERWEEHGITHYTAWRLRPRGRGILFAFANESRDSAIYSYVEGERWSGFVMSRIAGGAGYLVTDRDVWGLLDFAEIRQIVHPKDWREFQDLHADGVDYLKSEGVAVDLIDEPDLIHMIVDSRIRDRRALLRFPIGLVAGFLRPLFHVGRLRNRVGRRWQIERFKSN